MWRKEKEMKLLNCICLGALFFNACADDDGSGPSVYADISKRAQQNAVRYDGWKVVGGLCYSNSSFQATIKSGTTNTDRRIINFMLTAGIDWSKKFARRFIFGATFVTDIGKAQATTGEWQEFNYDLNERLYDDYSPNGSLDCTLKTPCITPEFSVKGGYIFPNIKSVVFLKLGLQYMYSEYFYSNQGSDVCSVKAIKLVPFLGLCGYRRLNKKLGVSLEFNFPFRRDSEKTLRDVGSGEDPLHHKVRMGRTSVRLYLTYSIPR